MGGWEIVGGIYTFGKKKKRNYREAANQSKPHSCETSSAAKVTFYRLSSSGLYFAVTPRERGPIVVAMFVEQNHTSWALVKGITGDMG